MTDDVTRHNLKQCPQCGGTRKMTVYKEYTHEEIPCLFCLGEGYIAAPAPEDKPATGMLYAALKESERLQSLLREQSENNADLFRQMEAEAHRADEAEARYQRVAAGLADEIKSLKAELAAARAEVERLRAGLEAIAKDADRYFDGIWQTDTDYFGDEFLVLRDQARKLFNRKGDG